MSVSLALHSLSLSSLSFSYSLALCLETTAASPTDTLARALAPLSLSRANVVVVVVVVAAPSSTYSLSPSLTQPSPLVVYNPSFSLRARAWYRPNPRRGSTCASHTLWGCRTARARANLPLRGESSCSSRSRCGRVRERVLAMARIPIRLSHSGPREPRFPVQSRQRRRMRWSWGVYIGREGKRSRGVDGGCARRAIRTSRSRMPPLSLSL